MSRWTKQSSAPLKPSIKSYRPWVFAVIVATLLLRGVFVICQWDQLNQDPDAYRAIAETLAETGVFGMRALGPEASEPGVSDPTVSNQSVNPIAFRPPLYPYLLSWITLGGSLRPVAVAAFHLALAVVTVLCTLSISRVLIDRGSIGPATLMACGLVIVDPVLLQQSSLVMTETLATALATAVIWCWVCRVGRPSWLGNGLLFGILLALSYLCRPTFLVWAVMMLPAILADTRSRFRERIVVLGGTFAVLVLAVAFWTFRNARVVGHPVWATTHGGYTLLLANNPLFYAYLRNRSSGEVWDAQPFLTAYAHRFDGDSTTDAFWKYDWSKETHVGAPPATLSEHGDDQIANQAAKETIRREPWMFVWSCFVRAGRLWSPMPLKVPGRSWVPLGIVTAYYILFYVLVIIAIVRWGRQLFTSPWWALAALVLSLTAVHAVYWSNLRMRAPAIPGLAILASSAWIPRRSLTAAEPCRTQSE